MRELGVGVSQFMDYELWLGRIPEGLAPAVEIAYVTLGRGVVRLLVRRRHDVDVVKDGLGFSLLHALLGLRVRLRLLLGLT
jgi:hypothetical protein